MRFAKAHEDRPQYIEDDLSEEKPRCARGKELAFPTTTSFSATSTDARESVTHTYCISLYASQAHGLHCENLLLVTCAGMAGSRIPK